MEGWIARWYTRTTGRDTEQFRRLAATLAGRLGPGAAVLEVAPGPGYLAIELARLGDFRVTGLDISRTFVDIASSNAARAGVAVEFLRGDVAAMPFEADAFDLIVCRAAFKNFPDPVRALDEMHRVLKPGGTALVFDLRANASPAEIDAHVRVMGLGRLDAFFTRTALRGLLRWAHTPGRFRSFAAASRFGACEVVEDSIGMEVRLSKSE
jgi:ubiquinone/menaquinone biosynthesis C-methylase UbiE